MNTLTMLGINVTCKYNTHYDFNTLYFIVARRSVITLNDTVQNNLSNP